MKMMNECAAGIKSSLCVIMSTALSGCFLFNNPSTFEDQLQSWDKKVEEALESQSKWISAYGVVQEADPVCQTDWDKQQLQEWRMRWEKELKSRYMGQTLPEIYRVRDLWISDGKLNLTKGDQSRQALLKRMQNEIPSAMKDCVVLADMQMGSDRNIARMKEAFRGFMNQVAACDANGGPAAIKKLDEIKDGYKKTCLWHGKIDELMAKLADAEVVEWYPVRPATYKRDSIASMESVQNEFLRQYKVKRWTVRVNDRRSDYEKVQKLMSAGRFSEAKQILTEHDLIVKPEGLAGIVDFDDAIERTKVANGEYARYIIKNLIGGLEGVQYHRRTRRGRGRGIYSMLVVGRAPIDEKERNKRRANRNAFKVARLKAEGEYSKFLGTFIESLTVNDIELKNGETFEQFKDHLRQVSKTTLNSMVILVRAIDEDEAVIILGWRNPEVGNVLIGDHVDVIDGVEVSPSVGAYL